MLEARVVAWGASCSCAGAAAFVAAALAWAAAQELPQGALVIPPELSAALTAGLVGAAVMFLHLRPWSDPAREAREDAGDPRGGPPLDL